MLDTYKPPMTKDEYLAFMRRNTRDEAFDGAAAMSGSARQRRTRS